MTVITGRLRLLAATTSIIVLAGMAVPADAGGLGGVVGGVTGAVGGIGGAARSAGGVVGGATSSDSQSATNSDTTSTPDDGILGPTPSNRALLRLKANVLGIEAGVYVVDNYGNLVRINARIADRLLNAKANAYVLKNGSLVKVYGDARLARLNAKAKVYVLDKDGHVLDGKVFVGLGALKAKVAADALGKNGKILDANAKLRLGSAAGLKTTAVADAGKSGVNANVSLGLGLRNGAGAGAGSGNGNAGSGNSGNSSASNAGISREIAGLSASERRQLMRKCPSVLSSPASYSADAVRVCRVVGQLAGL